MSDTAYPCFTASGSPREMGRAHGSQAAVQIRGFVEYLRSTLQFTSPQLCSRARQFLPLFESTCPRLVDEIHGLAEGAGIDFLEALACQLRGELAGVTDGACTTFVIARDQTAEGGTLIGQNSDNPLELMDFSYVLRLIPESGPRMLFWTFGGMLGYHGLNAHGVAHFANSLGGGPAWRFALSHYPLKRLMLEQRTLDEVRQLMRDVPVCSNGNYVLCDGTGAIADIELTSEGPFELPQTLPGVLLHSNHFVCAPHACASNHAQSLPDSFPRLNRIEELVRPKLGQLTVADFREILSDHHGSPTSLCRHPDPAARTPQQLSTGLTVASLIAEPDAGRLHIARGNPCETPFVTYHIHDSAC